MKFLLLLLCVFLTAARLSGQEGPTPEAVIEVKRGEVLRGKLLGYRYGATISLLTPEGEMLQIPWRKVRGVTFRSPEYAGAPSPTPRATAPAAPVVALINPPSRRWRHGIVTWIGLASSPEPDFNNGNFFRGPEEEVSMGLGYQFTRQYRQLAWGVSPAYEVMNAARGERLASLTGLVEYRLGKGRIQPVARLRAGISLPLGATEVEVTSRRMSPVYHPSVGIQLAPVPGRWSTLTLDLGYRFTYLETTTINQNLEVVERKAEYRRLTLTLGTNF